VAEYAKEANRMVANEANQFVIATYSANSSTLKMEEVRCCETSVFILALALCL
jgi:hypothetical protein